MLSSNAKYAYGYFINKGYTPQQAAGIVGNLIQESGVNPGNGTGGGDGGMSHGIAQWNRERLTGLKQFAADRGVSPWNLDTQLGYFDHELNNSESRAGGLLRNAKTVDDATRAAISFERPKGFTWDNPTGGHGWDNRINNANQVFSLLSGQPIDQTAPVDPTKIQGPVMPGTSMGSEINGPPMPAGMIPEAAGGAEKKGLMDQIAGNKDITGGLDQVLKGLGGGSGGTQKADTSIQPLQVAPMVDNTGARMQAGASLLATLLGQGRRGLMG